MSEGSLMLSAKLLRRSPACFSGGGGGGGGGMWLLLMRRCLHDGAPEEEEEGERFTAEWQRAARARLIKLSPEFKSLARSFILSSDSSPWSLGDSEGRTKKRGAMALKSLTGVCNLLEITAQQRRAVRLAISPQVTEHRILRGALDELLHHLVAECRRLRSPAAAMAEQIATSCLNFMADAATEKETPLWMQLSPENKKKETEEKKKAWGEVLEMLGHLSVCLGKEERVCLAMEKVEAMKEGLCQIKDLLLEKEEIGYKEARRQDCLVQKRLCKSLGHPSRCLFLLLLHYLYGAAATELDADLVVVVSGAAKEVHAGAVVGEPAAVGGAVKRLDRIFGVLELVWKTAEAKGKLELLGHIWCPGGADIARSSLVLHRGHRHVRVHDLNML